jgi:hypothetical protein
MRGGDAVPSGVPYVVRYSGDTFELEVKQEKDFLRR